ncbi:unnamed protein product [Didymodactylos carnosus]|uniref:Endo-1,3(4)-beta-glucanase 1 carbohydrate binding domain-containing protein n=1 Tax=Didymodactylos carnosus TaxID=1234261 RepID=A0A814HZZ8_9BILA|nr:unnamed protein product [Didymodactylos carnosus]CAF1030490.1 unnamed protein product [Didymodactylos carnosus]CAF3788792.1 unnamed protein product [Didymodactylos carnosus]CAF3798743.1 unnamed protein product [Didymodactylos carnosus]
MPSKLFLFFFLYIQSILGQMLDRRKNSDTELIRFSLKSSNRNLPLKPWTQLILEVTFRSKAIPFDLFLSSNENRQHSTDDVYGIVLEVNPNSKRAQLHEIKNSEINQLEEAENRESIKHWLMLDLNQLSIRYGINEISQQSTILNINLDDDRRSNMKQLQYVHVNFQFSAQFNTRSTLKIMYKTELPPPSSSNICGAIKQVFDPNGYDCIDGKYLCPKGHLACGQNPHACYLTTSYRCVNGKLMQQQ